MTEKPPFDLQTFLPYLLNQAAETSSLDFQSHYKSRYGMLRTEWRVLFHLGNYGRMTAGEIGRRARMHKTKISRAVQKLAERRWIVRVRAETDRRMEYLDLTPAGQRVYGDLCDVAQAYDARLTSAFSAEETDTLRRLLGALASPEPAR